VCTFWSAIGGGLDRKATEAEIEVLGKIGWIRPYGRSSATF